MFVVVWYVCCCVFYLPQKQELSSVWNVPGVNIDLDNLFGAPKSKTPSTAAALSMNQLASGSGGSSISSKPTLGSTSPSTVAMAMSGANYNINTSMMTSVSHGMGMPGASAPGMGMNPTGFVGKGARMNYGAPGGVGMGYGGSAGMQPFGVGHGNQAGFGLMVPGMNPMGIGGMGQQQQRPF